MAVQANDLVHCYSNYGPRSFSYHPFEVVDSAGREVGAVVMTSTIRTRLEPPADNAVNLAERWVADLVARERLSQETWHAVAWQSARRASQPESRWARFGASYCTHRFATVEERDAAIAAYLERARARAVKTYGGAR